MCVCGPLFVGFAPRQVPILLIEMKPPRWTLEHHGFPCRIEQTLFAARPTTHVFSGPPFKSYPYITEPVLNFPPKLPWRPLCIIYDVKNDE